MEQVLKRLYEIETAADAIMQKADERKKQMAKEMEEKTAAFDQKTQEETAETIAQKKEELMEQIQKELDAQHSETERLLAAIEDDYKKNHSQLAKQILQSLIQE
ncbi:MAG: ATPase [Lachnospiraceae bacterium]|nr:ATPase [Candidatus Fimimorpha excrementavium]